MENKDKKIKILLVEDDKFLLDMYTTKFGESGFEMTALPAATDALTKIESGYIPEVILTDIIMPTMDGFEFLSELKKRGLAEGAKKIILSNLGQKEDIEKGTKLGASGYIIKATSTPTETVMKVQEILENKGAPMV